MKFKWGGIVGAQLLRICSCGYVLQLQAVRKRGGSYVYIFMCEMFAQTICNVTIIFEMEKILKLSKKQLNLRLRYKLT